MMKRINLKLFLILLTSACLTTLTTVLYLGSHNEHVANGVLYMMQRQRSRDCLINYLRRSESSSELYLTKPSLSHFDPSNLLKVSSVDNESFTGERIKFNVNALNTKKVWSENPNNYFQIGIEKNKSVTEYINLSINLNKAINSRYFANSNRTIGRFENRRVVALNECSQMYNTSHVLKVKKEQLEHILVDEKHKLLFCYVPKVACTNWKRMFMLLTGKSTNMSHVHKLPANEIHAKNLFASLQNYSASDAIHFLNNYSKVVFVRNPLERLLSAYRNKLEQHYKSSKYFQARFGTLIVKNFRLKPTNASLAKGDDVTFTEFVKYIVSNSKESYNEHWKTINDLCFPCHINYDIIGKYETLIEDSETLFRMLGEGYSFPTLPKPSKTASSLRSYYKQLPKELILKLFDIYEYDFRLFNYDLNMTLDFK